MVFKPQTFHGDEVSIASADGHGGAATESRVADALARAADLDATNVSVTAVGEEIVLLGTVTSAQEIAIANDIAARVAGAGGVRNMISATGRV